MPVPFWQEDSWLMQTWGSEFTLLCGSRGFKQGPDTRIGVYTETQSQRAKWLTDISREGLGFI